MWIASPASPNSAAAIGTPTCTVLPKQPVIARTLGPATGSAPARLARRCHPYSSSIVISTGTKKPISVRHGRASRSMRAVVRNSSAGTKM